VWIDTHCHLDVEEFDADRDAAVARARDARVSMMVIPAIEAAAFARVKECAHQHGFAYALGIHPLYVDRAHEDDIERLRAAVARALGDARFVAIGEIGLDNYVETPSRERQQWFYAEQLKIARRFDLPVIMHVRRSADDLLKYLRRVGVRGGIAHAFNGSDDQAQRLIARGFKLGFGGAMTYDGSLRIRRFAATLPDDTWVLETDAPDIPPQWLRQGPTLRNEPHELARIGETMAQLRATDPADVAARNCANACSAIPRLAALMSTSLAS
jgi:TatD DNase family protein